MKTKKTNEGLGSYFFGQFEENSKEFIRLKKQASIGIELEKQVWNSLNISNPTHILDMGSGPGIVTKELKENFPQATVYGVDKNPLMIKDSIKNYGVLYDNLHFIEGDVTNIEIPDVKFDFIYCRFLFQHLSDPVSAINNLKKNLKPGGKICIVDVDDKWLTLLPNIVAFQEFVKESQKVQQEYGGDRFVGSKIKDYYKECGFNNIEENLKIITTDVIDISHFLDMTINFKYQLFSKIDQKDHITNLVKEILSLCDMTDKVWGAIGLFYVTAEA